MDNQKTGQFIAERRKALALTQKQLAERLSVSDRAVSRWERGVGFPDVSLLEPLADALSVNVLELLRGEALPEEERAAADDVSVREALRIISRQAGRELGYVGAACGFAVKAFFLVFVMPALVWLLLFYRPVEVEVSAADWRSVSVAVWTEDYGRFDITDREELEALAEQISAASYRKLVFSKNEAPDSLVASIAPTGHAGRAVMSVELCSGGGGTVYVLHDGVSMKEVPSSGELYSYLSELLERYTA